MKNLRFDSEKEFNEYLERARSCRRLHPAIPPSGGTPLAGHALPIIRKSIYRNKWEEDYARHLGLRQHLGEIVAYRYEAVSFRLAPGTTLNPDFFVVLRGGFEIHEVKGRHREKWWARFKIAASMYPWFKWIIVSQARGGAWTLKEVGK